jgi:hypothetical protein
MEMSMREIGKMIRHMVEVCIITMTAPVTPGNGFKMSKRDMELKNGQTDPNTKGNLNFNIGNIIMD